MLKEFKPEVEAVLGRKTNTKPVEIVVDCKAKPMAKYVFSASDAEILQRFSYLQLNCLAHRYLYYVKCTQVISDQEYDELEKELVSLRKAHTKLWDDSEFRDYCPTETVGSSVEDSYPEAAIMKAKQKLMDYEDIRRFVNED